MSIDFLWRLSHAVLGLFTSQPIIFRYCAGHPFRLRNMWKWRGTWPRGLAGHSSFTL
jgi:hypothetical protein